MNELNIILDALQFLLGQHTNDVDPDKAVTAQRHLGNLKSIRPVELTVPTVEPAKPAPAASQSSAAALAEAAQKLGAAAKPAAATAPAK